MDIHVGDVFMVNLNIAEEDNSLVEPKAVVVLSEEENHYRAATLTTNKHHKGIMEIFYGNEYQAWVKKEVYGVPKERFIYKFGHVDLNIINDLITLLS